MNQRTFTDHFSILVAGSVFLLGLTLEAAPLHAVFLRDGMGIGALGLFMIVAYATGHLVAVLGNVIENFVTLVFGSPSDFVTFDPPRLINPQHVPQLEERMRGRLGLKIDHITGIERKSWRPLVEQVYLDVAANNPGGIEASYGSYSINRELCAAFFALAFTTLILAAQHWPFAIGLAVVALIYAHRMRRLDVRFCRELFLRFLALPARPSIPLKPAARPGDR